MSTKNVKKLRKVGLVILIGTTYPEMGEMIDRELSGGFLFRGGVKRFPDGECSVKIQGSVRRARVVIVHAVRPGTIDTDLTELELLIDAAIRADADEVRVILPYFPYARQDRKDEAHKSISAAVVVDRIERRGARSLTCFDLHAPQIQGFSCRMPIDNLWPDAIFAPYIIKNYDLEKICLLSPDAGGLRRVRKAQARIFESERIRVSAAVAEKERDPDTGKISITGVIGGENLRGKKVVMIDDIASTCGTLTKVADFSQEFNPLTIDAACSHGLFVGNALQKLHNSSIEKVIVTDSLPPQAGDSIVEILSISSPLAVVIEKLTLGESISDAYPQT